MNSRDLRTIASRKLGCVVPAILGGLLAVQAVAGSQVGEIRGRILDHRDEPVAAAAVEVVSPSGEILAGTETDATGHFHLAGRFPVSSGTLMVRKDGYVPLRRRLTPGSEHGGSLTLKLAGLEEHVTVTALRQEQRSFETPRSVSILSTAGMREQAVIDMPQVLNGAAGAQVQRTNLGGGSPYLRGMLGNQVLVLVDGIRLNNSTFRLGPNQYVNTVDPFSIGRVEVVRGPSSSLYGSDSLGGVVNLLTRDPSLGHRAEVTFGYDTSADAPLLSTRVLQGTERTSTVAGVSMARYDDLRGGEHTGIQSPTGYRRSAADLKSSLDLGRRGRFVVAGQFFRAEDVPRFDRLDSGKNDEYLYDPQQRTLGYLRYELPSTDRTGPSLTATLSRMEQTEGRTIVGSGSNTETRERDAVETWGFGLQIDWQERGRQRWITGIETYRDRVDSRRIDRNLDTGEAGDRAGRFPDGARYLSSALYVQGTVHASDRVDLFLGSRYSRFDADARLQELDSEYKADFGQLVSSATVLFRPGKRFRVSGGVSQGFRAPGLDDATVFGEFNAGIEVPNPDLRPERLNSYEISLKYLACRTWASISVFDSHLRDMIVRAPGTYRGSPTYQGEDVYQRQNLDRARLTGYELEIRHRILGSVLMSLGATAVRGTNRSSGEPLRRIPPLSGLASVRWTIPRHSAWIEMSAEFAHRQDRLSPGDISDTRIPEGGTPGYAIFHLGAGADLAKGWTVNTVLHNLGDSDYKTHGSGIFGPGRSLRLHVQRAF